MEPMVYNEQEIELIVSRLHIALIPSEKEAIVLCLQGDLGVGKTTLTKALLKSYGVEESVQSPTFVIAKWYDAQHTFQTIVHIDAYRIESIEELAPIGFIELLKKPHTLIVIEWPEHITSAIPENTRWYIIEHINEDTRLIQEKHD